ncbi:hypothetical protein LRR18_16435, partial [Mangrovimonas sp. AS39]|uniref:hypothetical protein n=1 Tax=Mangrovimonas futianensis TaxID=2895523 RepID=UPI001E464DE8
DTLTPFEYSQIRETDEQLKAIKTKKLFDPYVTQSSGMEEMSLSVKGIDPSGLIQTEIGPLSLAGVNMTGAQLSRQAIQEDNSITIQEAARRAQQRGLGIGKFVKGYLSPGDRITAYVNKEIGGRYLKEESGITVPAVVISGGNNLNQALLQEGLTGSQGVNDNALNFKGVYGDSPLRKAWDIVTHAADTPFEALTPLAPAAKFIHRATALEDYQRNQVFGRE